MLIWVVASSLNARSDKPSKITDRLRPHQHIGLDDDPVVFLECQPELPPIEQVHLQAGTERHQRIDDVVSMNAALPNKERVNDLVRGHLAPPGITRAVSA